MATLDIQGKEVVVDDSFLKLPPERQNAVVTQIASELGIKPSAGANRSEGLRKAEGIAKSLGTGVAKGVADLAGLGGDVAGALGNSADWLANKAGLPRVSEVAGSVLPRVAEATIPGFAPVYEAYKAAPEKVREVVNPLRGSKVAHETMQKVIGPYRKAESVPEEYAETIGRFLPGAAVPGGSVGGTVRNMLFYGAIPAIADETAGQAFKGSAVEPYVRTAAGVVAGGVGAAAQRLSSAERLVSAATRGASLQQIDQAEALWNEAQRRGIPISRPEALQAVTNGATKIGDLQHTVEGMGGMKEFYAQRPAQTEAAARQTFDTIAPRIADPSQVGPAAGATAEGIVNRIRSAINTATRPQYDAAGQHLVPQQVHAAMMADPLFAETVNTIRNDPARNAMVQGLSDRNVLMYNEVGKELEQRSRNAAQPLNPQANQQVAAVTGRMGGDVKDIAVAAERASARGPSSLEAAMANQARLRERYLNPVLNGPVGKIAGQDTTTKAAIEALFPANPLPNSQDEISQTMRALSRQRPGVANDLVRAHAEMTFNEAAQRMASGGTSQSGGAKFAAVIRGNSQQAENLRTAVQALPHGDQIWNGFDRLLRVMEATQFRQATGSRTAFKIPGVEDLKSGGAANNVAQTVASGGIKLPTKISNAIQQWNVGRNLDQLADLFTSPEAAERFRQLATLPPKSTQFLAVLGRLGAIAGESRRLYVSPEKSVEDGGKGKSDKESN